MIGKEKLMKVGKLVLRKCTADQAEVIFTTSKTALTRFANNIIHQNNVITNISVTLRVVVGKRVGISSCNSFEDGALDNLVKSARAIANVAQENPDFKTLPSPESYPEIDEFDEATANLTPDERAHAVAEVVSLAREAHLNSAGTFENSTHELAVFNSLGVACYFRATDAEVSALMMGDTGSGLARQEARQVSELDVSKVAARAREKALASENPEGIAPGEYTVVLEPLAVGEMIDFLAYLGFGARQFQEGRSFMAGKLGEKITGDNITIWDDGLDRLGFPLPFDYEGVPKRKVMLIEKGMARGVVYDTLTAGKEGKESTGHALPPASSFGPYPLNLFVGPGKSSLPEMIASTDTGLLVTRFHYTNVSEPMKTIITGMTRDGTFLIEGGKVTKPVRNLRFTQGILEALSCVSQISRDRVLVEGTLVPALKIDRFRFSSKTEF